MEESISIITNKYTRRVYVMEDYIRIYQDAIDPDFCKHLIDKFETDTDNHEKIEHGEDKNMSFTQLNMFQQKTHESWETETKTLQECFMKHLTMYKKECNIIPTQWPDKYGFEAFRLKRYLPNDIDQFKKHVDVTNKDNNIRFLVFFLYLDDNDAGETMFPQIEKSSLCKKGSLLMFPPMWPWVHQGMKPVVKPKYIVGSYLHYAY